MRKPYWHDPNATLYAGDAREVLAEMPAGSVDCVVSSLPRWAPHDDLSAEQEAGHEPTAALFVAALRRVIAEAHRVLADDGTFWLVTSDRYAGPTGQDAPPAGRHVRRVVDPAMTGLPASSLIGLPWQIAFALQDDGWILRNAIVWHHADLDDDPAVDRLTLTYELIFLLTKQSWYHFDLQPIRQPRHASQVAADNGTHEAAGGIGSRSRGTRHMGRRGTGRYGNAIGNCRSGKDGAAIVPPGSCHGEADPSGRNPGDVWTLPARGILNSIAIEVPLRCIAAGCRLGGTVLDLFAGIATTGIAARDLGRSFIGIEASPTLCERARARLASYPGDSDAEPE
jgi:site-specific DNA-methyltransferase (cytosine-N4-specific)